MNTFIKIISILALLYSTNSAIAQYCGAATSNTTITPTTTSQNTASFSSGRRAFNFAATAGCTYRFSTCGLSGGDTWLRLYSTGTGGAQLASNDDACGTQSTINWTCGTSGTYSVLLTNWTCVALNSATRMSYIITGCVTPPANDLCSNATALPCGTTNLAGTTINTTSVLANCASDYGVWYTFTGDGTATTISTDAAAGFDHEMEIYSGGCGTLSSVACIDGAGNGGVETYTFTTTNTVVYHVYVAYYSIFGGSTDTGNFTISRTCPSPPANDLCAGAINLPCGTTNLAGSSNFSTNTAHGTGCTMSNYGVWYSFVGNGQSTTITVTSPGYNTEVSVSSGTCGSFTNVSCTDNGNPETVTFITTNAVTYYVYIAHSTSGSSTTGNFTISRTCTPVNTVTFNANGGTGAMANQDGVGSTPLTSNAFTQAGCYFSEWNTAADGSGTSYLNNASYSFASDITLYAQWVCGTAGCPHTITLSDSWNDDWDGGTIDVIVNGITVLNNITVTSGSHPNVQTFFAGTGDVIEVTYSAGTWPGENYFTMIDGFGGTMIENYYPFYEGTFTDGGNCDPPVASPGQDCQFPLVLCSSSLTVGNPGYAGTGGFYDFGVAGTCTEGEKNSLWVQIDIATTGNLNFNIIPNDGDITNAGAETDYDFLLWRMSGAGATTDCSTITSSSGTALVACNFDAYGVTGVATGGNAPPGYDNWFDGAYEPTVSTTAGDVYFLVVQNYSNSTQGFTLDFANSGAGVVNYTAPSTIYWTAGSSTNDWTDQANWGNCSTTPVCAVNAIITGSVANQPSIPAGDVRYVEDLIINNGATLTLANNATLHVCGDFTNNGNIIFGNNSSIIFDGGSTVQNIYGNCTGVNDFGNFIITKTGGEVILNCDIEIAQDFSNSNSTSVLNTNGFDVTLGRHFTNFNGNTTFLSSTGTLIFDGTVNQNYSEGLSQLDLNNVLMNNTSTGVTLLTDMHLNNTTAVLDLTDGNIRTNGFEVHVQNDNSNAIVNHSVNSYIYGNLRRNIQSLGAYEFPVGDLITFYQNAQVDFVVATSINNLLARFDPYPGAILPQGGTECSTTYNLPSEDNGFWTITADANATTGRYDLILYPTNATNTAGANGWTVTKKATIGSPTWLLNGWCDGTSTATVVKRNSMSGFSVFGAAQATIVLPSELIEFTGEIQGKNNLLTWSTASEINNDYFNLQRSTDGVNFEKIAEINGAGNSNTTLYYESTDYDPAQVSYYRLEMVDLNQSKQYSNIVRLNRESNSVELTSLYPNPSIDQINIELRSPNSDNLELQLFDYTGKLVFSNKLNLTKGTNKYVIDLNNYAKGIYNLRLFNDDKSYVETIKVIKE